MVGMTPLTRLLPETSDETYGCFSIEDEDGGVSSFDVCSLFMNSGVFVSDSGIIFHMLSSSLITSDIEGLASVSS